MTVELPEDLGDRPEDALGLSCGCFSRSALMRGEREDSSGSESEASWKLVASTKGWNSFSRWCLKVAKCLRYQALRCSETPWDVLISLFECMVIKW